MRLKFSKPNVPVLSTRGWPGYGLHRFCSMFESTVKSHAGNFTAWITRPFRRCFGFAKRCDYKVTSPVSGLLNVVAKLTVVGSVVSVVIFSVYLQVVIIAIIQSPQLERSKIIPFSVNGYTTTAVPGPVLVIPIKTSAFHTAPNSIQSGPDNTLIAGPGTQFCQSVAGMTAVFPVLNLARESVNNFQTALAAVDSRHRSIIYTSSIPVKGQAVLMVLGQTGTKFVSPRGTLQTQLPWGDYERRNK